MDTKVADRFWEKVSRPSPGECWEWTAHRDAKGYGRFGMGRSHRPQVMFAHRVAYILSNGPIGEQVVMHTCDNPGCCNPAHLVAGTIADNQRDMSKKRRAAAGEHHGLRLHPERSSKGEHRPLAKLTEDSVRKIRVRYAAGGISAKQLGSEYGVSEMSVLKAVWRQSWKHVL